MILMLAKDRYSICILHWLHVMTWLKTKTSEYKQEIPQSQTTQTYPRYRKEEITNTESQETNLSKTIS